MLPDQLANSGWTADKWDELEAHARETVNRHTNLRHVIPRGPDMPGAYLVNDITLSGPSPLSLDVKTATKPTSLEVSFTILSPQVGDFDMALRLVERAARTLAVREDQALYFKPEGLLPRASASADRVTSEECVAGGCTELSSGTIPYKGPYGLVAEPKFWSDMILPKQGSARGYLPAVESLLGADSRISSVVADAKDPEENQGRAVLFSIDPFAMDLIFVEPPTIAFAGITNGDLNLKLEERFRLRVIDGAAICKLTLSPPPPPPPPLPPPP